ncbi:MAG TPA: PaaI family thioesterase [Pyrinomonadaceae bacterium]|jgi:acyl-CoA thioesterase|nr:PaaI family thioesterase [Pyrinomonadaceae bacterium]
MNTPDLTDDERRRVERMRDAVPFLKLLGIEVESVGRGTATLLLPVREELTRNDGIIHGGAVASVIDSAFAFAIIPLLAEDERTVTVDLTIHYLRPLSGGAARTHARVVRAGRRVITVSAELFDQNEKLAATALSTYLRITT